jgi:hypothetical protein
MVPMNSQGYEAMKDYKDFMPLRNRITGMSGSEKMRSIEQMNTYWAACQFVADNIDHANPDYRYWTNKDAVDFQLRVALDFRDTSMLAVTPDKQVVFKYKSIAIKNLKHLAACDYFNRAFDLMTTILKMESKEKLIGSVKACMKGNR